MSECQMSELDASSIDSSIEINTVCSDEALEAAGTPGQYGGAALTLSFCSGLDTCPA